MQSFYIGWWLQEYEFERLHPMLFRAFDGGLLWLSFLGLVPTTPFIVLTAIVPYAISYKHIDCKGVFLFPLCPISIAGMLLPVYSNPHYAASSTAAIYALVLLPDARVRRWCWRSQATGLAIVRAVPMIAAADGRSCPFTSCLALSQPFPQGWCTQANPDVRPCPDPARAGVTL